MERTVESIRPAGDRAALSIAARATSIGMPAVTDLDAPQSVTAARGRSG